MPATAEEEWTYWDTTATDLRRNQITTVQASATKWSTLLTALLGVFGTVAFAGGLTTIDKLGSPYDAIARVITTLAVVAAIAAIFLFGKASGGLFPTTVSGVSASSVRAMNTSQAATALGWFRLARFVAILAGGLVILGSFLVLWVLMAAKSVAKSLPW